MARPNAADIGREKGIETLASLGGQLVIANSGRIDPPIVVEGGRQQFRREVLAYRRALPLLGRKRAHQRVALLLLRGEDAGSLVFAETREHRLRAHEVEIGRASCRERVTRSRGTAALKRT